MSVQKLQIRHYTVETQRLEDNASKADNGGDESSTISLVILVSLEASCIGNLTVQIHWNIRLSS